MNRARAGNAQSGIGLMTRRTANRRTLRCFPQKRHCFQLVRWMKQTLLLAPERSPPWTKRMCSTGLWIRKCGRGLRCGRSVPAKLNLKLQHGDETRAKALEIGASWTGSWRKCTLAPQIRIPIDTRDAKLKWVHIGGALVSGLGGLERTIPENPQAVRPRIGGCHMTIWMTTTSVQKARNDDRLEKFDAQLQRLVPIAKCRRLSNQQQFC